VSLSILYALTGSDKHTQQDYNTMNLIKKIAIYFIATLFISIFSAMAFAEAAAPVVSAASGLSQTIAHVEQGLVEVQKSDFAAANLHLKAAVESSALIKGNDAIVKEASANVVQGNIQSKQGEVEKSSEFLNKALVLYKSI
jgi:hypothetical protein